MSKHEIISNETNLSDVESMVEQRMLDIISDPESDPGHIIRAGAWLHAQSKRRQSAEQELLTLAELVHTLTPPDLIDILDRVPCEKLKQALLDYKERKRNAKTVQGK